MSPNLQNTDAYPLVFKGLAQVGGDPALDFLNTVKYRGAPEDGDRLTDFSDIVEWASLAGLISAQEAATLQDLHSESARTLYREILTFREAARALFPGGAATDRAQAAKIVAMAIEALRPEVMIDPQTGAMIRVFPITDAQGVKVRIVQAMARLLEARAGLSIKSCGGPDCDWLFIDRSKAKRRQWCDTRICGNAARVRRHRADRKAATHG